MADKFNKQLGPHEWIINYPVKLRQLNRVLISLRSTITINGILFVNNSL